MYELLLQESYAEWVVPLTIAVMWILSFQLFSLEHPVYTRNKSDREWQTVFVSMQMIVIENPVRFAQILIKAIKRKESPDDFEGPHLSIKSGKF